MVHRFMQIDVFSTRPFYGNPVAVVLDADDLTVADMQRIARWTNLSETTFVLGPSDPHLADYRLRIFGPTGEELAFAGHPTVGTAHAVIQSGVVAASTTLRQECLAGVLRLNIMGEGPRREIFVQVPTPTILVGRRADRKRLAQALGAQPSGCSEPMTINVGPSWVVACLNDADELRILKPDMSAVEKLSLEIGATGVTVFSHTPSDEAQIKVRSFAPAVGVPEDPVCGSGNACVGAFLAHSGMLATTGLTYVASQGTELGRDGRVRVRVDEEGRRISIGGSAVTAIEGTLHI